MGGRPVPVIFLLALALAPAPAPARQAAPAEGEIRLQGKVRSVAEGGTEFVLAADSFTLPNGRTGKIRPPREKRITLQEAALLRPLGGGDREVTLEDLKPGIAAAVVGRDAGPGKELEAREIELGTPGAPSGARAPAAPLPGVPRGELRSVFLEICELVPGDPGLAATKASAAIRTDPGNANLYYLRACARAPEGSWSAVLADLRAGNRQRVCQGYAAEKGLDVVKTVYPHYARYRQLARDAAAGAGPLGGAKGAALLREVRLMGRKVMEDRPTSAIAVLVGIALQAIADRALVEHCEASGLAREGAEAARLKAADEKWGQGARARFRQLLGKAQGIEGMNDPDSLAPEEKKRLAARVAKLRATEARVVAGLLRTRPR